MTDKEKLEKLKKLADAMYYAAHHLFDDASMLHKAMEEYHKFIINEYHKEEPVSEIDFEQELYKYFGQVKDFTLGMRIAKRFYEIGRNYLMKDAIDTVVKVDAGGYPYVDRTIELYDYDEDIPLAKGGDKVKIVVIKED